MPQNVRNFWLIAQVDGRATSVQTGPEAATGGIDLTVQMRDKGAVSPRRLRVRGQALDDGTLLLSVYVEGDDSVGFTVRTDR